MRLGGAPSGLLGETLLDRWRGTESSSLCVCAVQLMGEGLSAVWCVGRWECWVAGCTGCAGCWGGCNGGMPSTASSHPHRDNSLLAAGDRDLGGASSNECSPIACNPFLSIIASGDILSVFSTDFSTAFSTDFSTAFSDIETRLCAAGVSWDGSGMVRRFSSGVGHSSRLLVQESWSSDVCGFENNGIDGSFGERDSGRPGVFGRVFCAVLGASGAMAARAANGVKMNVCVCVGRGAIRLHFEYDVWCPRSKRRG